MDVFNLLSLIGGLTFFLYDMNVMSSSLEKMAGGRLEEMLRRMTANPFLSMVLGAVITIALPRIKTIHNASSTFSRLRVPISIVIKGVLIA